MPDIFRVFLSIFFIVAVPWSSAIKGKYEAKVIVYNLTNYRFSKKEDLENILRRISRKKRKEHSFPCVCMFYFILCK
jgi:hypothetical protein